MAYISRQPEPKVQKRVPKVHGIRKNTPKRDGSLSSGGLELDRCNPPSISSVVGHHPGHQPTRNASLESNFMERNHSPRQLRRKCQVADLEPPFNLSHEKVRFVDKVFFPKSQETHFVKFLISDRRYRIPKRTLLRLSHERVFQDYYYILPTQISNEIQNIEKELEHAVHANKEDEDNAIGWDASMVSLLEVFALDSSTFEQKVEASDGFFTETDEYYFDRSSEVFESIVHFHRTGKLHCPPNVCWDQFVDELHLWKVNLKYLSPCCGGTFIPISKNAVGSAMVAEYIDETAVDGRLLNGAPYTEGNNNLMLESGLDPPPITAEQQANNHNFDTVVRLPNGSLLPYFDGTMLRPQNLETLQPLFPNQIRPRNSSSPSKSVKRSPSSKRSPTKSPPGSRKGQRKKSMKADENKLLPDKEEEDEFAHLCLGNIRSRMWDFFEDPTTSLPSKIFSVVSISVVLISVLNMILCSMRLFQTETCTASNTSSLNCTDVFVLDNGTEQSISKWRMKPYPGLLILEFSCIVWFTIEFVIRFAICANRCVFLKGALNIVDMLSIMPFWFERLLEAGGVNTEDLEDLQGALMILRILRVLRVARIFKVAKYSDGLQNFAKTFTDSYKEFGMILIFLSVTIILFSTTLYFLEKDEPKTQFTSIPSTFWWCVVTMTTVGYGDMTPTSVGGRIAAGVASVSGVVVLAFPITVIVENFNKRRVKPAEEGDEDEEEEEDMSEQLRSNKAHPGGMV